MTDSSVQANIFSAKMFAPRTPFPAAPAEILGRGMSIRDRTGLGLASVVVRKNLTIALARRVREHLGLELPRGAGRSAAGSIALAGTGPGAWLASSENGHGTFAISLSEIIGDLAAVADQSDGYGVLRLSGSRVPAILSKLVPLDLDAQAFKPGHVATTAAAHVDIVLWRLDDIDRRLPCFEVAVRRSLAVSFWDALLTSAMSR
jgi:heterotetrameric sarcosine oxidase gamma subunit